MVIPSASDALKWIGIGLAIAIVSVFELFPHLTDGAEIRVWTSKSGFSKEAEFIGFNSEKKVVLRLLDGTVREVPLSILTDADQQYIHQVMAKGEPAKPSTPATSTTPAVSSKPDSPSTQDTTAAADSTVTPDTSAAPDPKLKRSLSVAREQAKDCRTPEEGVEIYDMLLGHAGLPADVRQQAEADRAEWKRKVDDGLVRFGTKWSSQSEVRAARIQAQAELKEGLELVRLNQSNLGIDKLLEASKTNPESIQADFIIATADALESRRFDEALQHYKTCLKRDPTNIAVLNNLALVEVMESKYGDAINHWKAASEQRYDKRIAQNMGRLIDQSGKRRISMPADTLARLTRIYSASVVSAQLAGGDSRVGWQYMLIPREQLVEELPSTETADASGDVSVVSSASGFAIAGGYLLTTRQLTRNAHDFQVIEPGGDSKPLRAKLVAVSPSADVALLQCEDMRAPPLALGRQLPGVESEVLIAGVRPASSAGTEASTTRAVVVATPQSSDDSLLIYDSEKSYGEVGGPVCNKFGEVVALHAKNLNLLAHKSGGGVPISAVLALLHTSRFNGGAPGNRSEESWAEVSDRVSKSVVTVLATSQTQDVGLAERIGNDFLEDCTCCRCKGRGVMKCTNPSCMRGTITVIKTRILGYTPQGVPIPSNVTIHQICPVCGGRGFLTCSDCGGSGFDPELRFRPASKALAQYLKPGGGAPKDNTESPSPAFGHK
ncbi:MAG TPA: trypsin-like peptidase domain-containing protein [Pirellulales bacterium]|jgi:S1-C subfamily serine protease|nr:trypsin-like peptidase domain-containing protein [Pirellulales bacterium]